MNQKQKKVLLKLARETIEKTFEDKKVDLDSKELNDKIFEEKRGAFVTLHKKGVGLRGCIGFVYPILELKKAIADGAVEAAFHDPRFPPLQKEELKDIILEISVLTKPEPIIVKTPEEYFDKIEIGKDGLMVFSQYSSGLLLPQVFTEFRANPKIAFEMTCEKAGLSKDSWKTSDVRFLKFQAEIFHE